MRFKYTRFVVFIIISINLIVIYHSFRLFISFLDFHQRKQATIKSLINKSLPANRHVSKLVTVIIQDFDLEENDVSLTAQSFINVFPNLQIFILYDILPYPPLNLISSNNTNNVKLMQLGPNLKTSFAATHPIFQIKTKYVLFIPDSTRIHSKQNLQGMLTELTRNPGNIIVAPFKKELNCLQTSINIKEWTLKYTLLKSVICDCISGKHVILLETEILKKISNAFLQPFPQSLYLQTAALSITTKILKSVKFQEGKPQLKTHLYQEKQKQLRNDQLKQLYQQFRIKRVIRETGQLEWYGCTRETPRCFGPVLHQMPSYLYADKWTPPCCLANLRKTARYVFSSLDEAGIRYWLEFGSLLGAIRNADILPWDHNVDIGFHRDDLNRNQWLEKARNKPVLDNKGFLWEKATEGNFFRVFYSKQNRIHVNLLPFFAKNGTMIKDSWFTGHKQMEFPEKFLHPMSSLEFIGRQVSSPNNVRDFIELKFGKGAIEHPLYPDSSPVVFP